CSLWQVGIQARPSWAVRARANSGQTLSASSSHWMLVCASLYFSTRTRLLQWLQVTLSMIGPPGGCDSDGSCGDRPSLPFSHGTGDRVPLSGRYPARCTLIYLGC